MDFPLTVDPDHAIIMGRTYYVDNLNAGERWELM